MPDFGDDFGMNIESTMRSALQQYWMRMIYKAQSAQGTGGQSPFKSKEEFDPQTGSEVYAPGGEVKGSELGDEIFIDGFESVEMRDEALKELQNKGIMCAPVTNTAGEVGIKFSERDIGAVTKIADNYIEDVNKERVEQGLEPRTFEAIKAEYELDNAFHGATQDASYKSEAAQKIEAEQTSWKEDLHSRVQKAYEMDPNATESAFIKNCSKQGVTVDYSRDGKDFLFKHPDGGGKKVLGKNLDKDSKNFTLDNFKDRPVSFEEETKDVKEASKGMAADQTIADPAKDMVQKPALSR